MGTRKTFKHSSTGTGGKQPSLGRMKGVAITADMPTKEKRKRV